MGDVVYCHVLTKFGAGETPPPSNNPASVRGLVDASRPKSSQTIS